MGYLQIIDCLQNSHNGLFESPTGTGKTLVMLSAVLSWQKQQRLEGVMIDVYMFL